MKIEKSVTHTKYKQPIRDFIGRTMNGDAEIVDFVPQSHLRIWYNIQEDGYELHHHNAAEIILCMENLYPVTVGNETFNLNSGDILFIPPNMLHRIHGGAGTRFVFLVDLSVMYSFIDFSVIELSVMHPLYLTEQTYPRLYKKILLHLNNIIDIYFKAQSMWELLIYSELLQMYAEIGKHNFNRGKDTTEEERSQVYYEKFASLLKYIDSHYGEELSLDWAASYTGFSKYHFLRLFKDYTGMTYYDHLSHKRIQAAQRMLLTDESVTNIAIRTGFNNLTSFSRSFKNLTGISPSQYRSRKEKLDRHGKSTQLVPLPAAGQIY
ncbi:MAG: helix-turn-helix transcriptional regulator [Lachnospiraceae bacterium]|nr:helix-turn-helix transcriptional regulator [Lachnospiraceae bacterium]